MKKVMIYLDEEDYEFILELCRKLKLGNKSGVIRLLVRGIRLKFDMDEVIKIVLEGYENHMLKKVYDLCVGYPVSVIVQRVRLSKSTVYQYLNKLLKLGLVIRRGQRYYQRELIEEYYRTKVKEEIEWWKREIELAQKLKDRLPKK